MIRIAHNEVAIVIELLVILALVLLNGILAGAEIAILALRRTRIEQLAQGGSWGARAVKRLRDNPDRFLATVQIGITVVSATAGAFGGARFSRDMSAVLRRAPWLAGWADELAMVLVVTLISYLSLVLGELVPKSLALRYSERYALLLGKPLLGLSSVARPIVWLLTASSNLVLRIFGDRTTFSEARVSPDELRQIVDEASKTGSVDPNAGEIASRAIDFAKLTAAQVMIPRGRVIAIPLDAPPHEVRRVILEEGHTRMPVYEGTLDRVVGYVTIRDMLALFWESQLIVLKDALRPVYFVPKTARAVDLLAEMKRRRTQIAVVADDDGATAGIITLEDLVEELVGDILSEHDEPSPEMILRDLDGSAVVKGDVPVRELNRALKLNLPEGETWSTIAGLCLELAGRIPEPSERFTMPNGTVLEILDATPRHIRAVRVRPPPPGAASKHT